MIDETTNSEENADMRTENTEQGMPTEPLINNTVEPTPASNEEDEPAPKPPIYRRMTAKQRRIEMRRSGEMREAQNAKRDKQE